MSKMKDTICFDTPDFPQEWEDDITFSREYEDFIDFEVGFEDADPGMLAWTEAQLSRWD